MRLCCGNGVAEGLARGRSWSPGDARRGQRGARDWDANARSPAWLAHQGQRLTESLALVIERPDIAARFDEVDKAYLDLCQAKEKAQRAEKDRRRRRSLAALVIVVVGLSAAAIISFYQWQVLGRTRIEAKLIAYQDAVKKAQESSFTKRILPNRADVAIRSVSAGAER